MNYHKLAMLIKECRIDVDVLARFLEQHPNDARALLDSCGRMLHDKLDCRLRGVETDGEPRVNQ